MTKPHIQIIIGSTRDQRRGPPIARWFAAIAAEREDITSELVDLAEFDLPFLSGATPPMTPDSRDDAALGWGAKVADGDGYVFVIPEYNHGYPAAVKNALDHLFSEWSRKPIGFVSYGGLAGGVRAVEQLRRVAVELDMVPVRRQVAIARIWQAIDEHGKLRPPVPLQEAQRLLDDIGTWATALRAGRAAIATAAAP
ncbi:MAG TPA: NAD(P)H-dependent oxidoreductase [Solirubrobacteraceae bacterium]|nr:NAD(P)H-dependent oxidoreductase [Solirubrobacteraceae bacterium]